MRRLKSHQIDPDGVTDGVYGLVVVSGKITGLGAAGGGEGGFNTRCRLRRQATAQTIPNLAATDIAWDTEVEDTHLMWSPAAPGNIVIPATGLYRVTAYVGLDYANATGINQVAVNVGGSLREVLSRQNNNASSASLPTHTGGSALVDVSAGDILAITVFQSTGASRTTYNTLAAYAPRVDVERVA